MAETAEKVGKPVWQVSGPLIEARRIFPSLPPVLADYLWRRGLRDQESLARYLAPDYGRDLFDPFLFSQMNQAVRRIFEALANGEHLTIYSDYDADGLTGGALLFEALRELKFLTDSEAILDFYIPHREREGYGLQEGAIRILLERGTSLILTVDCGIASTTAIAEAKNQGIDTIVVDHHEFPLVLPEAILIHPRLSGETYPFPYLAAAGVAWKLACALYKRGREQGLAIPAGKEKWFLDLVAIATVTDVVPLAGENRVLEHFGLKVLGQTRRLGLQKLIEVAGIKSDRLDTFAVGFQIGPRLNAAGRMDHAEAAFRLLISQDEGEAGILALKLQEQNQARQRESNRIWEEARIQLLAKTETKLAVVMGQGWPAGLVGLVAGKLVSEFGRPALVMGQDGERVIGSGRSVPGFNLIETLVETKDCLDKFGGHPQACGFTICGQEKLAAFMTKIQTVAELRLNSIKLERKLEIEGELRLADLDENFVELVEKLAPFGEGNPAPRFLTRELTLNQIDRLGETGRHLRFRAVDQSGISQKFMGFGWGERAQIFAPGQRIDLVYEVGQNIWNGSKEVQCKLIDFDFSNYA